MKSIAVCSNNGYFEITLAAVRKLRVWWASSILKA